MEQFIPSPIQMISNGVSYRFCQPEPTLHSDGIGIFLFIFLLKAWALFLGDG